MTLKLFLDVVILLFGIIAAGKTWGRSQESVAMGLLSCVSFFAIGFGGSGVVLDLFLHR